MDDVDALLLLRGSPRVGGRAGGGRRQGRRRKRLRRGDRDVAGGGARSPFDANAEAGLLDLQSRESPLRHEVDQFLDFLE